MIRYCHIMSFCCARLVLVWIQLVNSVRSVASKKTSRLIHTQWLVECKWIVHAFAHGLPVPSDQVTKRRQKQRGHPWCKKTMNYTAYPRSGAFNSKNSGTKMDQTWATLVHLVTCSVPNLHRCKVMPGAGQRVFELLDLKPDIQEALQSPQLSWLNWLSLDPLDQAVGVILCDLCVRCIV